MRPPLGARLELRLAPPALAAWSCAAIGVGLPGVAALLVPLWVLAGASVALALRRRGSRWPLLAAGALIAGALVMSVVAARGAAREPPLLVEAAAAGRTIELEAQVTGTRGPRTLATVTAARIGDSAVTGLASPALVFGDEAFGEGNAARIGATVRLSGTVAAGERGDDVAFLVFADRVEPLRGPPTIVEWAAALRDGLLEAAGGLPGDGGRLLPGLAIGDTRLVDARLDAQMTDASLSHLTAVSGANCAIVVGLVMMAGSAFAVPRGIRVGVAVGVLGVFVVLVTPQPSVLRAAAMAAIVLVALASGRPARGVPVLCLAVLVLLVADPWLARDFGFVLSVAATGALLLLAAPLGAALERWLPRPLALLIAVPLAAQLVCQPITVLLEPSVPLYGVLANALAAPAAPVATIVGLVACLLLPSAPVLGESALALSWLPAAWIGAVASGLAGLPLARLPWIEGWPGAIALAVLTAAALTAWLGSRHRLRWLALAALLGVSCAGVISGSELGRRLGMPGDWRVAVCDVGQGDAVLLRSAGQTALIDTGARPERLERCLDRLGIGRIELLVLTHFDLDHVGGVAAVRGRVDDVLVGPSGSADDERIVAGLREAGARVTAADRGLTGVLGSQRWSVLWPLGASSAHGAGNDASVILSVQPAEGCDDCFSGLFLGDLGEEAQERLLAAGPLPRAQIVKVSHHGSADQSERLYRLVAASVGLIGVGADNGYGHPTSRLLGILAATSTTVARTDTQGMVMLAPDEAPGSLRLWTERPGREAGRVGGAG